MVLSVCSNSNESHHYPSVLYTCSGEKKAVFLIKKATKTDDWCTIRSQIVSFSFLNWNNCTSPIEWLAAIVAGTLRAMPKHPMLNRCNRNKLHFCAATIKTIYCRIVAHVALLEYNNFRAHTVRKRVTYKQKHTPHTHKKRTVFCRIVGNTNNNNLKLVHNLRLPNVNIFHYIFSCPMAAVLFNKSHRRYSFDAYRPYTCSSSMDNFSGSTSNWL